MLSRSAHPAAHKAVYATGAIGVVLIMVAAAWLILRDYRTTLRHAELNLDNFAIVLAVHTRLALDSAEAPVLAGITPGKSGPDAARVQAFFSDLYGQLDLAYEGRIFVFRSDGTLVTVVPEVEGAAGRVFDAHPLFDRTVSEMVAGAVQAYGFVETDRRLITWRRIRGYPLLVAFSTPITEVLAPWWRATWKIGSGALLLATMILAGAWLLARQLRTSAQLARDVAESERRLQSIIGSAMDAIITIDEEQNIVLFNAAAESIFGCRAAHAIGASIDRFIPERFRTAHRAHVRRFGEAGITMRRMGGDFVLSGLRASGDEFPIDASISHVTIGGRRFFTVILRDITQRQRAADALARSNEELREMYQVMHDVRESERTRIARELHDELAQWLTALKLDAAWIASRPADDHAEIVATAERMKGIVADTVAAMRRIAADLRPVMLDDLGLVPAIENLLHQLAARTGIRVSLRSDEHLVVGDPLATALYRMVQEALTNVARHAEATEVTVDVHAADGRLRVTVRDDGRGLRPDPSHKSYGLLGMRERARTLGGSARVYSPESGGTVVEIDVPFRVRALSGAET